MSEETLLIVSLGLCFGMVVMAAHTGFSAAFGGFIMGSILAETVEAESIESVGETGERSFWCRILRVGRYDGGSCNDCGICTSYHCNNTGCYSGTVLVRYVGCAVGRAAFEDG